MKITEDTLEVQDIKLEMFGRKDTKKIVSFMIISSAMAVEKKIVIGRVLLIDR